MQKCRFMANMFQDTDKHFLKLSLSNCNVQFNPYLKQNSLVFCIVEFKKNILLITGLNEIAAFAGRTPGIYLGSASNLPEVVENLSNHLIQNPILPRNSQPTG